MRREVEQGLKGLEADPIHLYLIRSDSFQGESPRDVAMARALRHTAVTGVIAAREQQNQVDGFIGAAEWRVSEEEVQEVG